MLLKKSCLSFSPGDWDVARKEWTGSVRHLWSEGNPFLSFTTKASECLCHSHFGCRPLRLTPLEHAPCRSSPFPFMSMF